MESYSAQALNPMVERDEFYILTLDGGDTRGVYTVKVSQARQRGSGATNPPTIIPG